MDPCHLLTSVDDVILPFSVTVISVGKGVHTNTYFLKCGDTGC